MNKWKQIKTIIPFKIIPKKAKCLSINLTKHVQDVYAENYKVQIKEIKEGLNK